MSISGIFSSAHVFVYRTTGGRLGSHFRNADVLLLTTTGRKTGKKRTRPVLFFRDGNRLVIVGSNGGRRSDPAWWANLKHDPTAQVQIKRAKEAVRAERAAGIERDRLWTTVTSRYPGYLEYQKKTEREIPVILLKPVASDSS